MQAVITKRDILFREFQIMKFNKKNMVPAVTMTVNIDTSQIMRLKDYLNSKNSNEPHITVTHIIIKAVADTLIQYPVLYSFFNGKEIVENRELIVNIPVDVESHVEYIVIHRPESKTTEEISKECYEELNLINSGNGTFMNFLLRLSKMSIVQKIKCFCGQEGKQRFLREHYGVFPISNFGSFHINSGTVAISQPMIAAMCFGSIVKDHGSQYLSLTLTFDHRAVDGAYAGKFLNSVRTCLEQSDSIIPDGR